MIPAGCQPAPESGPLTPLVIFLGDSLTEGFALPEEAAYPALIGNTLEKSGIDVRVVNAGQSGNTSSEGLERLEPLLEPKPDLVVVALGVNDHVNGLPLEVTEENLRRIIRRSRERGASVVLVGQRAFPFYEPDYAQSFSRLYPELAKELGLSFVPFLLEGVAGRPDLNLADGIHPNARGHEVLARNVLPEVARSLKDR